MTDLHPAAQAFARHVVQLQGKEWRNALRKFYPSKRTPHTVDRLALMLVSLRADGVDVLAALPTYQRLADELGVTEREVDE